MATPDDIQQIRVEEAERAPNRYVAKAFWGVLAALLLACIFNEIKLFDVDRLMIWGCFALAAVCCLIARYLSRSDKLACDPRTKYVLMALILLLTLAVTVFLNISAILLLLLPMLMATRYRSLRLSGMAVAGSAVICLLYPILAWMANSWSLNILTGYVETTCKITILNMGGPSISVGESIFNMLVYLSLPQIMVVGVFGSIILGITRNSIQGLENRIRVEGLRENLNKELEHVNAMQDQILYSLADIVENRDYSTGGHIKRTSHVVKLLVEAMRKDPNTASATASAST